MLAAHKSMIIKGAVDGDPVLYHSWIINNEFVSLAALPLEVSMLDETGASTDSSKICASVQPNAVKFLFCICWKSAKRNVAARLVWPPAPKQTQFHISQTYLQPVWPSRNASSEDSDMFIGSEISGTRLIHCANFG